MSIARQVTPIRIGVLMDFRMPPPDHWDAMRDILDALRLTFAEALASGQLDRPVELVVREVDGLPRGTVKDVIDAYAELVDEGCLAVFGPMVSENAVPVREEIERRFRVPSISLCGSDEWLGEWTFALSNGSLTDEPYVLANLCARAGQRRVAVLVERSLIGPRYLDFFRQASRFEGLTIAAETWIPQTGFDAARAIRELHELEPDALVHLGFGLGAVGINEALRALGWNPPRYMGTAWEDGYCADEIFETYLGWIGLEQYDEANRLGQDFLDRFQKAYGRRPEYYAPVVAHDVARAFAHALDAAEPLSPRGVMQALERVKMLPAASGSPGTRISFGKWTRRGWMGAGYLVAREVAPDLKSTVLRGRYGQD
jgi:ABC-type branched-subunit amino acid transport system substrate-binding protein